MTSFARTPEGRAAAERMMREFGHTNFGMRPRPGFPGRSPATPQAPVLPQQTSAGLVGSMPANSSQLAQMQGLLGGTPVGGGGRLVAQPPAPPAQQPVRRSGVSSQGSAPPSMASQLGGMGLAGTGLQQMFGNKPAGMKKGGAVKKKAGSKTYKSGGSVSSASKRADGCAIKGKTKGRMV